LPLLNYAAKFKSQGEKKTAAKSEQEIGEMLPRQRRLGASDCFAFAGSCQPLPTFAWSRRDGLNLVPKIPWNDVTVLNIEKWPTATFCEKTTKASDRKQAGGRN